MGRMADKRATPTVICERAPFELNCGSNDRRDIIEFVVLKVDVRRGANRKMARRFTLTPSPRRISIRLDVCSLRNAF